MKQVISMLELHHKFGGTCAYCKDEISLEISTRDHFLPTALGGPNHPYNIILSCIKCNTQKADMQPITYLRSQGIDLYDPAFKVAFKNLVTHSISSNKIVRLMKYRRGTYEENTDNPSLTARRAKSTVNQKRVCDDFDFKCAICTSPLRPKSVMVMMVLPRRFGGRPENDNFIAACHKCFTEKNMDHPLPFFTKKGISGNEPYLRNAMKHITKYNTELLKINS